MDQIKLFRTIDKTLTGALAPLFIIRKKILRKKGTNKAILIIRLWGMGDSITTLPLIKALSKKHPIDVLTTKNNRSIFSKQPFIRKTYELPYLKPIKTIQTIRQLARQRYDIVIDTEQFLNLSTIISTIIRPRQTIGYDHSFRGKIYTKTITYSEEKHFVENFINLGRIVEPIKTPKKLITLTTNEKSPVQKQKGKIYIGIHLGTSASAKARRWPEERFAKLINELLKEPNTKIILTGTNEEKEIYQRIKKSIKNKRKIINLINKINLEQLIALLKEIDLFIANDTGPMHLAAAQGTKVIALFGMNHPQKVGPWPLDKNISIYHNPQKKKTINNKYGIIPPEDQSTITLISVEEVKQETLKNIQVR